MVLITIRFLFAFCDFYFTCSAGETEYGIDTAMESRLKLLKAYESVEALRYEVFFRISEIYDFLKLSEISLAADRLDFSTIITVVYSYKYHCPRSTHVQFFGHRFCDVIAFGFNQSITNN